MKYFIQNKNRPMLLALFAFCCLWSHLSFAKHHTQEAQSLKTQGYAVPTTSTAQTMPTTAATPTAPQPATPSVTQAAAMITYDPTNSAQNLSDMNGDLLTEGVFIDHCAKYLDELLNDSAKMKWALKVFKDLNTAFENKKGCLKKDSKNKLEIKPSDAMLKVMVDLAGRARKISAEIAGGMWTLTPADKKELMAEPSRYWKDGSIKTLLVHLARRIGTHDVSKANDTMGDYIAIGGKTHKKETYQEPTAPAAKTVVTPAPAPQVTPQPAQPTPTAAVSTPTVTTAAAAVKPVFTFDTENPAQNLAGMKNPTEADFATHWETYKRDQLSPNNRVQYAHLVFKDLNNAFEEKRGCFAVIGKGKDEFQLAKLTDSMKNTIKDIANFVFLRASEINNKNAAWQNITMKQKDELMKDAPTSFVHRSIWRTGSILVLLVHCFRRIGKGEEMTARDIWGNYKTLCEPVQPNITDIVG